MRAPLPSPLLRLAAALPLPLLLAAGCADKSADADTSGGADGGADGADGGDGGDTGAPAPDAVCDEPTEVECVDALILDLSLHDDKVSEGAVDTTQDGEDFITVVDATAGGYNQATNNPWVYIKFTPEGAQKIELDDESALESMDWDMSLRRFILRLNSGASGPSCVGAAALLESSYDEIDEAPDGLPYAQDAYYTGDCTIINDSSGLPGSPQVAMSAWWSYQSCVQTTFVPHILQLADGHLIKLVVETYYLVDQDVCNERGSGGDESGWITLRWRYLQ
jgi:hypothetical protein